MEALTRHTRATDKTNTVVIEHLIEYNDEKEYN